MTRALRLIQSNAVDGCVSGDEGSSVMGETEVTVSAHVPGFLVARGYAPSSRNQRRSILGQFVRSVNDLPADRVDASNAFQWWADIAHLSASSRRSHLSTVRCFYTHLIVIGAAIVDPTLAIVTPRVPPSPPVTITAIEILRLIACLPDARDRAIAGLMLGCGLRAGDAANVLIENIDLDGRVLSVLGKGGKTRLVPMPTATVVVLQNYLKQRPATHGPLLRQLRTEKRCSSEIVQDRMTQALWAAGIKRAAYDGRSSHVLRRTCATTLLESGLSIRVVQTIMGHDSIASTQRYLALPDTRRLLEAIEQGPMGTAA